MEKLVFKGTVFSGKGDGKRFVDLPWVRRQIQEKLGFSPYSGTLNIRLTKESTEKRNLLEAAGGLEVEPQAGYYPGTLFRAYMNSLVCAVVLPLVPNYPSDVLEVIAPVYLRGQFKLKDGSQVTVKVTV